MSWKRGHLLPVGDVAARALGAAFDDVPGHDAGGQPVPVVHGPAELVDHRRQGDAGVGDAAGDDDLAAGLQGRHHRFGAEVDVGRDDAVAARRRIVARSPCW